MNNRQKLGYMALGASVLVVGIRIGQFLIIAGCSHEHEIPPHEHGEMVDHMPAQFLEASYEIVAAHYDTIDDVMLNWTIRFDKPPQALQVTNAEEYTLLGAELRIVAKERDEDISVVWDGGKKKFSDPFPLSGWTFGIFSGVLIKPVPGSIIPSDQRFSLEFIKPDKSGDVDVIDATIHGIPAIESKDEWSTEWSAVVNLPKGSHSITAIWRLSNGIEGFQTFSPYIVE